MSTVVSKRIRVRDIAEHIRAEIIQKASEGRHPGIIRSCLCIKIQHFRTYRQPHLKQTG